MYAYDLTPMVDSTTMSTALQLDEPQPIEEQGFKGIEDYRFSGNDVTIENKRRFLHAYRQRATITHAAFTAGISRKTAHHYINTDEGFAEALMDCHEDTVDTLEASVYERAKKSDLLAMFWLKAHRPKFRDKVMIDIGAVQAEIQERVANNPQLLPATTTNDDNDQS
jgi:hypothetical protein